MSEARFSVDYSKRLSKCKKCKAELGKGVLRMAKLVANAFDSEGNMDMKMYYHVECLFDTFSRARSTTKTIESVDDIDGFAAIQKPDQKSIIELIKASSKPAGTSDKKRKESDSDAKEEVEAKKVHKKLEKKITKIISDSECNSDDRFEVFQTICEKIARHSGHLEKTKILKDFFEKGIGNHF